MDCSMPGLPVHHQLLEFTQNLCPLSQWCHPTISSSVVPFFSCLQSFAASGSFPMSQFFTSGSQSYWSFSFSISSSNECSGLISFRIDWLDLLSVQGTLKSLLQHHSSKASILWHSGLFMVQLSHPYMTTGKTIALTRRTFVGKVMSLLLNMLSRLVITRVFSCVGRGCLLWPVCSLGKNWLAFALIHLVNSNKFGLAGQLKPPGTPRSSRD